MKNKPKQNIMEALPWDIAFKLEKVRKIIAYEKRRGMNGTSVPASKLPKKVQEILEAEGYKIERHITTVGGRDFDGQDWMITTDEPVISWD
jgi:hypothetical protein